MLQNRVSRSGGFPGPLGLRLISPWSGISHPLMLSQTYGQGLGPSPWLARLSAPLYARATLRLWSTLDLRRCSSVSC